MKKFVAICLVLGTLGCVASEADAAAETAKAPVVATGDKAKLEAEIAYLKGKIAATKLPAAKAPYQKQLAEAEAKVGVLSRGAEQAEAKAQEAAAEKAKAAAEKAAKVSAKGSATPPPSPRAKAEALPAAKKAAIEPALVEKLIAKLKKLDLNAYEESLSGGQVQYEKELSQLDAEFAQPLNTEEAKGIPGIDDAMAKLEQMVAAVMKRLSRK
jgi:hypothetical protein